MPDKELVDRFRQHGGGGKLVQGGTKVCWGPDEDECVKTVHACGRTRACPASSRRSSPSPRTSSRRPTLVTEEMIAESVPCGPDVDQHVAALQAFADAGFDELYVQQIGDRQAEFFDVCEREVLPRFRWPEDGRAACAPQADLAGVTARRPRRAPR